MPERGYTDIDRVTWARIQSNESFRELWTKGILTASLRPGGSARLHGSCYVGRAICGDVAVELREKIPGALASLLSFAASDAFRVERAEARASEAGELMVLLMDQFLSVAASYASHGREREYRLTRHAGSLAGGRLDVAASLRMRARGLGHRLVFDRSVLTYRTPMNRIVLAGLREVERLSRIIAVPAKTLSRARALSILFSDCRDAGILFGLRESLVDEARTLIDRERGQAKRDLLALAAVILAHESFDHERSVGSRAPRSWFLNLETLFETAVREVAKRVLAPGCCVSGGADHNRRVFPERSGEYAANPDIVISNGKTPLVVGDVKYKEWNGTPSRSDVYQLLAHAAAFDCDLAFLIFPSDSFGVASLGKAATGCQVVLFKVDVGDMAAGMRQLAVNLGLTLLDEPQVRGPQEEGSPSEAE